MKDHFAPALVIGSCIIIGSGIIAMSSGTVSGLIGTFIAIAGGGWLLFLAGKLSTDK